MGGQVIDRDALAAQICAVIRRLGSATTSTVELELGTLGHTVIRETLAQLVLSGCLAVAVEVVRYDSRAPWPSPGSLRREYRAKVYRLANPRRFA